MKNIEKKAYNGYLPEPQELLRIGDYEPSQLTSSPAETMECLETIYHDWVVEQGGRIIYLDSSRGLWKRCNRMVLTSDYTLWIYPVTEGVPNWSYVSINLLTI